MSKIDLGSGAKQATFLENRRCFDDVALVGDWLSDHGLADVLAGFNPLCRTWENVALRRVGLEPFHQSLVDFFIDGAWLNESMSRHIPHWVISILRDCGLITTRQEDGATSLGQYSFWSVFAFWLVVERPTVSTSAYFGDDSIALLSRLRPRAGERALDFCTGPGIQALWLSRFCRDVTGIDINPFPLVLAELNAKLNRINNVNFWQGDLEKSQLDGRYDLVCANPPLVPLSDDTPYGIIGHGGLDGLRFTNRILNVLPELLTDQGRCQILGLTISDGILPLPLSQWAEWTRQTGIGLTVQVGHHFPFDEAGSWLQKLSATSSEFSRQIGTPSCSNDIENKLRAKFSSVGASALCDFFLFATKSNSDFRFIDLSIDGERGLWYV